MQQTDVSSACKWYFAANLNALEHAFDQIRVAVISAQINTKLRPFCLVDDHGDLSQVAEQLDWLEKSGVSVGIYKSELFKIVRNHFGQQADIFSGHWLRSDIPVLETEDEFVIYTDIDVMFRKSINISNLKPPFLACATEHRQDDFSYFNSGIMVMNIPALRKTRGKLIAVLKDRLGSMEPHDDQGAFNVAYRHTWTHLSNLYNWKPYWGYDPDAAILHFHGPKPAVVRRMVRGEETLFGPEMQEIFRRNPEAYGRYLAEFDDFLAASKSPLTRAQRQPDRVAAWLDSRQMHAPPPDEHLVEQMSLASDLRSERPETTNPVSSTRRYRPIPLRELADAAADQSGHKSVEYAGWLSPSSLLLPPVAFGDSHLHREGLVFIPSGDPGERHLARDATPAFLLSDVLLHGQSGIMTIDDVVVSESVLNVPLHTIPGAGWEGADALRLPQLPLSATIHSACHLLLGRLDNYYHWMIEAMTRLPPAQYEAFSRQPQTTGAPILLVPTLDLFWKWETLAALVSNSVPRVAVAAEGRVFVQRLLYVPDLSGGMFNPHPALLEAFDAMRARVLGGLPARRPWRRLYVSRADSRNRVLDNEAEVAERAERAGFTPVVLSKLSIPEQIRLFAEASHILAPHGAGLTNIGFCQPGAALCELHMDSYVHWAFRYLAAVRGVRYGCLVGTTLGPRQDKVHDNVWQLDLAALDAVLADPRFMAG
jgi:capsular polysaccharide biosynthesis protein